MANLKVFLRENSIFLFGLLLTLSLLWPLLGPTYFTHHDDVQMVRLFEMDKCIRDGQIPCRWVPDLGGLYGYPLFNYYAPLSYYIGEIFYLLTGSLMFSAKIMFAIPFVGAYIFMFLLGRKLWGNLGGLLSGVFYSFAPYHAVVFYVRGAMGEIWSLMFFPAIFWAVVRLKDSATIGNTSLLAIFVALLALSHNLSTMIFIPVTLAFAVILFAQKKDFKFLALFIASLILGLFLAAFYWLPAITEKDLVHVETTTSGYFSNTEHFKGLRKLFLENSWGWGASVREVPGGERDGMSFQIGWVHVLGWLAAITAAVYLWRKDRRVSILVGFLSAVALGSIFMINPRSEFIWRLIEPLKYLQFPWRFLMLIIFSLSLMSGSLILCLKEKKKIAIMIFLVLVVVVNFSFFRPEKFFPLTDSELLSGAKWDAQIKRSIFDFLPKSAKAPPAELATVRFEVLSGKATISGWREGSNWIYFKADVEEDTKFRLSQYYFPNWRILLDGHETEIDSKNDLGLMTITLNKGAHTVEAKLWDTPVRILANSITVAGLAVLIFLGLYKLKRKRIVL
ncbi:hypothetical protein A3A14_00830 [Candidatus Daviesbacteria bacterium RIFCSPLOWO2_01_FULL_43_38]|uniref:Membrane protein 6-pyruvoyl-tetrahydropterin synthase-related domain-containing protein n=1 Tax=Candidatus Daviesbacteria bacterium RIFCSPHIGHO2_12_FULL_43_11 TaxID=1797780 RepID=A0A1F5K6K5_9BACT|nr:MAG: hypothetical protein A3E45_00910 [Candidatus Daviesbacteria bacterium RIFCSPHIGHO2_12_FULL_43_11]OGE63509.1 MAG: hypothetical protein A3A14_00830 [Candidatus Daviesbacteria bacterium RIFCSPLOWO2_01_FULL_43_38]